MTDEYDALRRALSQGAASAPTSVDPAAARRAGDARVRTRTAITTSLAFSLVIFAGLGSVYFAAHRSRPSSLGSDVVTSTPNASPSVAPPPDAVPLSAYFQTPPVAGVIDTLHISGPPDALAGYVITWGDGMSAHSAEGSFCTPFTPPVLSSSTAVAHTYATAGMKAVIVTTGAVCGTPALKTSFNQVVLPGAVVTLPAFIVPPVRTSPKASVGPTASASASGTPGPSGIPSPSGRLSASASASAPASASLKPSRPASPAGTPTVGPSAVASPGASASPLRTVVPSSPTETKTPH